MIQLLRSLDSISTGYTVFEKDQVLTHDQLNRLGQHLDDQDRLTRVTLLGVGVVCGLRAILEGGNVTLTRGVGVTTDGDLLWSSRDTVHDRYRPYDEAAPAYDRFFSGGTRIPLFELVRQGDTDPRASPLGELAAHAGRPLTDMVAVLLMESREKDRDLCSSNDCDNLGKDLVHTQRLLLVDQAAASGLAAGFSTPDAAARALGEVVADRAAISAFATVNALATAYRTASSQIDARLRDALPKIYPACSGFLADVFGSDPTAGWMSRLAQLRGLFMEGNATGVQYYYDFLKDVVETYNAFRELLFGEMTVCVPDLTAFPKHLLLGRLSAGAGSAEHRTGFYPSPAAGSTSSRLGHARFLAWKLHALIQSFKLPPLGQLSIRITPSMFEDRSLEERAIPCYYDVTPALPIHQAWSYELERRGMSAHNYSYNAAKYGAQGAAASPLTAQIGKFSFFRIEGHLGAEVSSVTAALEAEIKSRNLPIAVCAVRLGPGPKPWRRPRYTDLHRFHYLLRQDLVHELTEVETFADAFKGKIDVAVNDKLVLDSLPGGVGLPVKETAERKRTGVKASASAAKSKLAPRYSEYKKDSTWKTDVSETMKIAGEFKYDLGKVVKTEFTTPFDSIIGNRQLLWLDWLDRIIQDKEDKAGDKLTFAKYLAEHPGLEHFAGVPRGGTFVLVYDSANNVVADFALPYMCCEEQEVEEEAEEPPLVLPPIKPPWILDHGISVLPPLEKFVDDKIGTFKTDFVPQIEELINPLEKYFSGFKESLEIISKQAPIAPLEKPTLPSGEIPKVQDPMLDLYLQDAELQNKKIDYIRERLLDPELDEEMGTALSRELTSAERGLAGAIKNTADYMADKKMPVNAGSDGAKAVSVVSKGMTKLTDETARNTAIEGIAGAAEKIPGTGTQKVLGAIARKRPA